IWRPRRRNGRVARAGQESEPSCRGINQSHALLSPCLATTTGAYQYFRVVRRDGEEIRMKKHIRAKRMHAAAVDRNKREGQTIGGQRSRVIGVYRNGDILSVRRPASD